MRPIRFAPVIGSTLLAVLGLASVASKAHAFGPMWIEACTDASCSSTGKAPPAKSAEIWAGTGLPAHRLFIGTWDTSKKKWVTDNGQVQITDSDGEILGVVLKFINGCGTTLHFAACYVDDPSFDCNKWNGKPNSHVSDLSNAVTRCK